MQVLQYLCLITAGIKKFKSIIKKNKNKLNKIVLLAKSELNSIEVLIYKALIDSNISHNEFISVNNVLKEYDDMKEEIKNSDEIWKYKPYIKQSYLIVWRVEKIQKVKIQKL